MIKELILHVGDAKNGSSSIQAAMQARACHCPTVSYVPQQELNASPLANSLRTDRLGAKRRARMRPRLFAEKARWAAASDADLGIISAEYFSGVVPKDMQAALTEYLPDYAATARILAYVRPHAARALSGYSQRIKVGFHVGTLSEFADSLPDRKIFYYASRFDRWQQEFGGRFTLRPFIREEMRGGDVVEDFFHQALRGAPFTLDKLPSSNESLALEELAAMRSIQSCFIEREVPKFLRQALGAAAGQALGARSHRYRGKLHMDRGNAEKIRAAFLEDAKSLDAAFFQRPLMQEALEQAVEQAPREVQELQAELYYDAAQIAEINRIAAALADLGRRFPQAWRSEFQYRTGQRVEQPVLKKPRQKKSARQIWALLDELTEALLPAESATLV